MTTEKDTNEQKGFFQKYWMWLAGGGCILFILFIIVLIAGYFLLSGGGFSLFSGGKDVIVYSVSDQVYGDVIEIHSVEPDGENNVELISNDDGMFFITLGQEFLAVLEPEDDYFDYGELGLVNINDGNQTFIGDNVPFEAFYRVVSKDGSRFAYIELDEDDEVVTLFVYEIDGELVTSIEEYVPIEFVSNSEMLVLYFESEDDSPSGFGILDLDSGEYLELSGVDMDDLSMFPRMTPDGKYVFYGDDEDLMRVDADGGNSKFVYEFDNLDDYDRYPSLVFFEENNQAVLVEDTDMYLFDVDDGPGDRIDSDVYSFATGLEGALGFNYFGYGYSFASGSGIYGAPLLVSPDGDYLAYVVDDGDSFDLKVYSFSDGSTTRIGSGGYWFSYAFTPNSKSVVVLEYDEDDEVMGELYSIGVDGSDRVRLDKDVTSFKISPNGKRVYYATADDLYDEPDSDIYSIKLNGEDKTTIEMKLDGFVLIVDIP